MPELPEVEITARRLDAALRGATIESALTPGINALKTFDPPLHAIEGEEMLAGIAGLEHLAPAVRATHEAWDGSGYPDGLTGEEIPLTARIVRVVDAFDAMTSERAYRQPLTRREALQRLRAGSGMQFDPRVVDALLSVL